MLFKNLTAFIFAAAVGITLTLDASAASRFKIQNDTDKNIFVLIYMGDDSFCFAEQNSKRVEPESSDAFGCTGNGKNRCQVKFRVEGKQICKKQNNSCFNDSARKLRNGAKAVIAKDDDGDFVCTFY